jgi:hypothetical protein
MLTLQTINARPCSDRLCHQRRIQRDARALAAAIRKGPGNRRRRRRTIPLFCVRSPDAPRPVPAAGANTAFVALRKFWESLPSVPVPSRAAAQGHDLTEPLTRAPSRTTRMPSASAFGGAFARAPPGPGARRKPCEKIGFPRRRGGRSDSGQRRVAPSRGDRRGVNPKSKHERSGVGHGNGATATLV